MSFLLSPVFPQQNPRRGQSKFFLEGGGERWPKQCTHVSKCKNDKIKEKKKRIVSNF
jgi:hypothetical protein